MQLQKLLKICENDRISMVQVGKERFAVDLFGWAPERFRNITQAYCRGSNGLVIVYDMSYRPSFENVDNWFRHCFEYKNDDSRIILLANKSDKKREVSTEVTISKLIFEKCSNTTMPDLSLFNDSVYE